jgi:hypothetical protein
VTRKPKYEIYSEGYDSHAEGWSLGELLKKVKEVAEDDLL